MDASLRSAPFLLALTVYAVGVASPGPSDLAIMSTATTHGRSRALMLAAGVISGSVFWGLAAAFGLSALMRTYSWSLVVLKVLGGLYLLWLSWQGARSVLRPAHPGSAGDVASTRLRHVYWRGLAMHLTNPKAIVVWLSIVVLATPSGAGPSFTFDVVASCACIGAGVFLGYALAFSTRAARVVYARVHRGFNATLSLVYAFADIRLLLSRTQAV